MMLDNTTVGIIIFFLVSSAMGHILLHRVIRTPAQYKKLDRGSYSASVKAGKN